MVGFCCYELGCYDFEGALWFVGVGFVYARCLCVDSVADVIM